MPKHSRRAVVWPERAIKTSNVPGEQRKITREIVVTYQCLELRAMLDGMPRGDNLFLHSLGHLFDSRVQNLGNLCVRGHI